MIFYLIGISHNKQVTIHNQKDPYHAFLTDYCMCL